MKFCALKLKKGENGDWHMPPVFSRLSPDPHPYDLALGIWLGHANLEHKAMARNIMHDHRVSVEREQSFDNLMNRPRTASELRDALIDYKKLHIQVPHLPQFLDYRVNGNNIVSGSSAVRQVVHKDVQLVRVIDVNGLIPVFQWAKRNRHRLFMLFPSNATGQNVDNWISQLLRRYSKEQFVQACLNAMNGYSSLSPFHPTWAAAWNSFVTFIGEGPSRWIQVMGMARPFPSRWLMLLRYKVREAGTVVRPTQLDVGWGPYHFPSPPKARTRRGGHPMDLKITTPSTILLSEFIHRQIPHTIQHWIDAGSKLERTLDPTAEKLDIQRNSHHQLLVTRYGRDVVYWMPKCT